MRFAQLFSLSTIIFLSQALAEVQQNVSGASIGDVDAPMVVVEYSSLTCAHCAKFHREVLPIVEERYVRPGKMRLEFHHYPLDGVALKLAALVDHVTPMKRFHLITKLFETQDQWIKAEDPVFAAAQVIGFNREEADKIVEDKEALDRVVAEVVRAHQERQIDATPSFIISGRLYPHALQLEAFEIAMGEAQDSSKPHVVHVSEPQ